MGKFKDLPADDQPYEKCIRYGAGALSDSELLAVFVRTGTKNENPIDIARNVLVSAGDKGLVGLMNLTLKDLKKVSGIGDVKAVQLSCLAELSKRISKQKAFARLNYSDPASIADLYMERLRYLDHEQVWACAFDSKCNLISETMISSGTVNASLVTPREVMIYALKNNAVNIVLVHNHPSGSSEPSGEDISLTKRIAEAGILLNVRLLDHIIIGDCEFTSLSEMGIIN